MLGTVLMRMKLVAVGYRCGMIEESVKKIMEVESPQDLIFMQLRISYCPYFSVRLNNAKFITQHNFKVGSIFIFS